MVIVLPQKEKETDMVDFIEELFIIVIVVNMYKEVIDVGTVPAIYLRMAKNVDLHKVKAIFLHYQLFSKTDDVSQIKIY